MVQCIIESFVARINSTPFVPPENNVRTRSTHWKILLHHNQKPKYYDLKYGISCVCVYLFVKNILKLLHRRAVPRCLVSQELPVASNIEAAGAKNALLSLSLYSFYIPMISRGFVLLRCAMSLSTQFFFFFLQLFDLISVY